MYKVLYNRRHLISLVILDRDGVINQDRPHSVRYVDDFKVFPTAPQAIKRLNQAGIPVVIATNQAVVDRGDLSPAGLNEIHEKMTAVLANGGATIDKLYVCTSQNAAHIDRKPNPGMLHKAMDDFGAKPENTLFIGDALRDYQAACHAGCHFILVRTGKGRSLEKTQGQLFAPHMVYEDLAEAIAHLTESQPTKSQPTVSIKESLNQKRV